MNIKFGESVIRMHWQSRVSPHRTIVKKIILAGLKFGDFSQNCQIAKLRTLPKFPTILYVINGNRMCVQLEC